MTRLHTATMLLALTLAAAASSTRATDKAAQECFEKAMAQAKAGHWKAAARLYLDAELHADDLTRKANAVKEASIAYQKAGLQFKEYECLKKLVEAYPEHVDVPKAVRREYDIGNSYLEGYREEFIPWLPWVEEKDRSMEIYESVLKQAPYAEFTPRMLLRMASMRIGAGENDKAEEIYKEFIKTRSDVPLADIAYLELANVQLQLAEVGDGDGAYCEGAKKTLKEFIEKFPKHSEVKWAKESLKRADEIAGERVYKLARYYYKDSNLDAATRYCREVIVNFPETKAAPKAEGLLGKIDAEYHPPFRPEVKTPSKYVIKPIPEEVEPVLHKVEPGGKWLLPITDMNLDSQRKDRDELKQGIEKSKEIPANEF